MERRSFLSLGLLPLAATATAATAAANASSASNALRAGGAAVPPPAEPGRSRAARSGFLPNVPLVTHRGEPVLFYDDLVRGKTVLLNFFLVGCSDGRCPTATANLRQVQELLGERVGRDIFFYSITLAPESDTPSMLDGYVKAFDIKPGWTFLTGKPADVDRLRRGLGYVDPDPQRDKDPATHINMARYGNDRLERWGAVSLRSSAANIASTFRWLTA